MQPGLKTALCFAIVAQVWPQVSMAVTVDATQFATQGSAKPYYPASPDGLLRLLTDLRAELKAEEDQDVIQLKEAEEHDARREKAALIKGTEQKSLLGSVAALKKQYDDTQTAVKKRKAEFSQNQHVRDSEEAVIGRIGHAVREVKKAGTASATTELQVDSASSLQRIAHQAESRAELTKVVSESIQLPVVSKTNADSMRTMLIELSRAHYDNLEKSVKKMTDSLHAETEQDKKAVLDLHDKLQNLTKHLILEQARLDALKTADASETRAASDGSVAVAKLDKAHKTTLFLRKAMRRTITKIEKMIRALFAGASEAKATGTSARRLLVSDEVYAAVSAVNAAKKAYKNQAALATTLKQISQIKAIQRLVVELQKSVKADGKLLNAFRKKYESEKRRDKQGLVSAETKASMTKRELLSAAQQYEKALQDEQAAQRAVDEGEQSAAHERKVMFQIDELLRRLETQAKTAIGSCPVGINGKVCSGYGNCNKHKTAAGSVVYGCICNAKSRTGKDCSECAYGFKAVKFGSNLMECIRDMGGRRLLSADSDELAQLVTSLQAGVIPQGKSSTVKTMLRSLKDKLDKEVEVLRVELNRATGLRRKLQVVWLGLKKEHAKLTAKLRVNQGALTKARTVVRQFRAKQDVEAGIRSEAARIIDQLLLKLNSMLLNRQQKKKLIKRILGYTRAPTTAAPTTASPAIKKTLAPTGKETKPAKPPKKKACGSRWALKSCSKEKFQNIGDQLKELFTLKKEGALTDAEYSKAKKKVLNLQLGV